MRYKVTIAPDTRTLNHYRVRLVVRDDKGVIVATREVTGVPAAESLMTAVSRVWTGINSLSHDWLHDATKGE